MRRKAGRWRPAGQAQAETAQFWLVSVVASCPVVVPQYGLEGIGSCADNGFAVQVRQRKCRRAVAAIGRPKQGEQGGVG